MNENEDRNETASPTEEGATAASAPLKFEEAVVRLEAVARELESADIPLEMALARFEEGVRLSRYCMETLDSAQGRIEQLIGELNGTPEIEPAYPALGEEN